VTEIVFLKDRDWSAIDGEACRIMSFTPMGTVVGGRAVALDKTAPYASIKFECTRLSHEATGFITHQLDFLHLWSAFEERGVADDEEVIVFWTKTNLSVPHDFSRSSCRGWWWRSSERERSK
jgi:hypothetical protein